MHSLLIQQRHLISLSHTMTDSTLKTNCTCVTLVAMVCVSGYCGNCRVTFFFFGYVTAAVAEAHMNFVKKVARSFPSISPLPDQFLPHSISIFHHSTSHGSISLTFNFLNHPSPSAPLTPSSVCLSVSLNFPFYSPYLSTSTSSLILSSYLPSIFASPCCEVLPDSASLPSLFLFPVSPLPLHCSVLHHKNCCHDLNSSGVACSGGTTLTTSWFCVCVCLKSTNMGQSCVWTR